MSETTWGYRTDVPTHQHTCRLLQGMADPATGEQYVGYLLPGEEVVAKRKAEDMGEDVPGSSTDVCCVHGC